MVFVDFSDPARRAGFNAFIVEHTKTLKRIVADLASLLPRTRGADVGGDVAVVDIDEVVLVNIHENFFEDFFVADYFVDPAGKPWPRAETLGPAYPGARLFLAALAEHGLATVFVTSRRERLRSETLENFVRAGLGEFISDASLVMCPDAHTGTAREFKTQARRKISETHRIVLNVGDQPSDLGEPGCREYLIAHDFYVTE